MRPACQTLSKAFWISRNANMVVFFCLRPVTILSVSLANCCSVEWEARKPNCSFGSRLFVRMWSFSLFRIIFSAIFAVDEIREIGLQFCGNFLSLLGLSIGMTIDFFQVDGK